MAGPQKPALVQPGDSYLLVNNRDQDMEAYDHSGQLLWTIPCLARGQGADTDWSHANTDTPPGLYRLGQLYADYEQNPNPLCSDTAMAYGWYSLDMEELEGQEVAHGRAGIMLHGGGSACGWPGAWAPQQPLHPTLGCIRLHNADLHDRVLPLYRQGTVFVGVFQEKKCRRGWCCHRLGPDQANRAPRPPKPPFDRERFVFKIMAVVIGTQLLIYSLGGGAKPLRSMPLRLALASTHLRGVWSVFSAPSQPWPLPKAPSAKSACLWFTAIRQESRSSAPLPVRSSSLAAAASPSRRCG